MASFADYADVQGLVRFGYARMAEACYLLLTVKNALAASKWLENASVANAVETTPPPRTALQIAFTREGLESLKVPSRIIAGFSSAFLAGMSRDGNRSRRLGDTHANAPARWRWGGADSVPHMVVMLFAEAGLLQSWRQSIRGQFWEAAFDEMECLPTTISDGREPFGFHDGISQPDLDWELTRKPRINSDQLTYGNLICLGEFLLGYRNEYGRYTDRPLLDPDEPGSEELLYAEDEPGKKDLGLNGTYVVMRQLQQDVRGFWRFLDKLAGSDPHLRYGLAEAFVGRKLSEGAPLVPLSKDPIEGVGSRGDSSDRKLNVERNQFTYEPGQPGAALCCPLGAHIRRANPRNADIPGGNNGFLSRIMHSFGFGHKDIRADLTASTRFHRLLRRGREYGEQLSPEEALQLAPANDSERGLHFIAINANIERQFEFVQDAWMMRTSFGGLTGESDPLLGNRAGVPGCLSTAIFSVPHESGVCRRMVGLPQFITVRGGAYFFLPSIRALRYLSKIHN